MDNETKPVVVMIAGRHGTGKTTLATRLRAEMSNVTVVTVSQLLKERSGEPGLEALPPDERERLVLEFLREHGAAILDTHLVYHFGDREYEVSDDFLGAIDLRVVIWLTASDDVLTERIGFVPRLSEASYEAVIAKLHARGIRVETIDAAQSRDVVYAAVRRLVRPAGFEPATFSSGG